MPTLRIRPMKEANHLIHTTLFSFQSLKRTLLLLLRQLTGNKEFTDDIRFFHGRHNSVADALCRPHFHVDSISRDVINFSALAAAELTDKDLQCFRQTSTVLILQEVKFPVSPDILVCDVSSGRPRPYVPPPRRQLFDGPLSLSYRGIRDTHRLLTSRLNWPEINIDDRKYS